jgi:hypothetical protein
MLELLDTDFKIISLNIIKEMKHRLRTAGKKSYRTVKMIKLLKPHAVPQMDLVN